MSRTIVAPRRLASRSVLAVLVAALVLPVAAVAADLNVSAATVTAQEARMVALLNQDRAAIGLVPVRADGRLMAIARARSADMVAKHYFGHTQPDGRNVFTILTAQKITWYTAGEIIAENNYPIDLSASTANRQWMGSAGHKAIIVSTNLNYVGVGLAVDPATGKKLWTAVYLKGPDRSGARAAVVAPTIATGVTQTTKQVGVTWSGSDLPLQVLTSGLASYRVERRLDGGAWTLIWAATGRRTFSISLATGHAYQFRVAGRDHAGNLGAWSTATVDLR